MASASEDKPAIVDFASLRHCGRREELKFLHGLVDKVGSGEDPCSAHAVILEADPGMGKTALVDLFSEEVVSKGSLVCRGEFEEHIFASASEPFAALIGAVKGIVKHIVSSGEEERAIWNQRIRSALEESELELLREICPSLNEIHGRDDVAATGATDDDCDISDAESIGTISFDDFGDLTTKEFRFERFRLAVRGLIRCVAQHTTLVVVLDDFHWVDPDSYKIIETILEDKAPGRRMLFVLSTRLGCELTAKLRRKIQRPETTLAPEASTKFHALCLSPLSADDIASLVAILLHRRGSEKDLSELADIVKDKAAGSPFIVIQFLRLIEQKGLLPLARNENYFNFDCTKIAQEGSISDCVTNVMVNSLMKADEELRKALIVAASFGVSHFKVSTIAHAMAVLDQFGSKDGQDGDSLDVEPDHVVVKQNIRTMRDRMIQAERDGFVQQLAPGHYRFSHDRIRDAAYSLLPEGRARKMFHLNIGRTLRLWIDTREEFGLSSELFPEESLILHATRQMNAGSGLIEDAWEKLELSELNFQSAAIASRKTSFHSSMFYLQKALTFLNWKDQYDSTLKVSVALTRMQYSCGLFEESLTTAETVLAHTSEYGDKRPVYFTMVFSLLKLSRVEEAMDLVVSILNILGQPIPRRFVYLSAVVNLFKTRQVLRRYSDADILSFPRIHDERVLDYCVFLERLGEIAYLGDCRAYNLLHPIRMVQLATKGGLPLSGLAFSFWGVINVMSGDFASCERYGQLGLKLAEPYSHSHPDVSCRAICVYWWCLAHWKNPLRAGLVPVSQALVTLTASGMLDSIHVDTSFSLRLQFLCGEKLGLLLQECRKFSESLLDFQATVKWSLNAPLFQAILNLYDPCDNPAQLTGEFMNEATFLADCKKTENKGAEYQYQFFKLLVSYHFHELDLAASVIASMRKDTYIDGPFVTLRVFYAGLVFLALFRKTNNRKYQRKGRPFLRQMRTWAQQGAANCVYMHSLLLAEQASCTGKGLDVVRSLYDKAIEDVTEMRLCNHQALANELAGIYLMNQAVASADAAHYLSRAVELYEEWGAMAKVQDLKLRYAGVMS